MTINSPEAMAFKEMYVRLRGKGDKKTLIFRERCHEVTGVTDWEYIKIPEISPTPEITTPRRYVFSSRRPPSESGNFVYYIQPDDYNVSKVGKHSGTLSKLVSRYKNGYNTFDVIAYDCGQFDYSKVEKAVLAAMGARGVDVVREQVATGVGKFFCVILEALLSNTCGDISVVSVVENDFTKWYREYAKLFDITNEPRDAISAKDIHDEYNKRCLETGVKLISYKDLVREISAIEDRWVDGSVVGVKMNIYDFNSSDTSSESDGKIERVLKERVDFTNNLTDHLKITNLLPLLDEHMSSTVLKKSLIRILGPVKTNDPRDTRLLGKLVLYANAPHIKGAKMIGDAVYQDNVM